MGVGLGTTPAAAGTAGPQAGAREEFAALRDIAVTVAREAGALVAEHSTDHLAVQAKSTPTDAVTEVDRASEALIVRRLGELRPGDGILGEEGTSRDGTTGVRWIVDPLDGTVNYVHGLPTYSVSIAAERDGVVVAGAVFDAYHGHLFEAALGGGARRDGLPLACSDITDLALALVGTGFAYRADDRGRQGRVLATLLPKIANLRRFGSSALDLCMVATGQLDGYYERGINPWDRAAGLLIAAEAGARGAVVQNFGAELTVAAAPAIYDALLAECSGDPDARP